MSSYLFEDTKRPFDTLCRTFNTRFLNIKSYFSFNQIYKPVSNRFFNSTLKFLSK